MEPDSLPLVDDVALLVNQVAVLIHDTTLLVNQLALGILLASYDFFAILVPVEVASDIMRIKVESLNVEGWRQLSPLIKVLLVEYLLSLLLLHNVTGLGIEQVTLLVDFVT